MNEQRMVVKMIFGSHLYGTATPSSDKDFKGVFLPSKRELCLLRANKTKTENTNKKQGTKNTSEDTDTELFSLHKFIQLACEGQTVALDMLHAPEEMLIKNSDLWKVLCSKRHEFYTKNLKAFIGYARRQASKYGIRGSRLNAAKSVLDLLNSQKDKNMRMSSVWDTLPKGEHLHDIDKSPNGIRQFQICGKIVQETQAIENVCTMLNKFYDEYGTRAIEASKNKNIDWKAVSHALRAAYQVKEILTDNTITFPLKQAEYLKTVKLGLLDYSSEVQPELESVMEEVERLSKVSTLPENVDTVYWDDFVISVMEEYVL